MQYHCYLHYSGFIILLYTYNDHSESELDAHWLHMHRRVFGNIDVTQNLPTPSYLGLAFIIR